MTLFLLREDVVICMDCFAIYKNNANLALFGIKRLQNNKCSRDISNKFVEFRRKKEAIMIKSQQFCARI